MKIRSIAVLLLGLVFSGTCFATGEIKITLPGEEVELSGDKAETLFQLLEKSKDLNNVHLANPTRIDGGSGVGYELEGVVTCDEAEYPGMSKPIYTCNIR